MTPARPIDKDAELNATIHVVPDGDGVLLVAGAMQLGMTVEQARELAAALVRAVK